MKEVYTVRRPGPKSVDPKFLQHFFRKWKEMYTVRRPGPKSVDPKFLEHFFRK
jgi:hypothetical protein